MLKRAHKGTFHKISHKHMHRYINEFTGRHNIRELDTLEQMAEILRGMDQKRLMYKDLMRRMLLTEVSAPPSQFAGNNHNDCPQNAGNNFPCRCGHSAYRICFMWSLRQLDISPLITRCHLGNDVIAQIIRFEP